MLDTRDEIPRRNMRDFDIQFGTPSHGWMSLQVVFSDRQWHSDVSDVPCDSIRGLVSSLSMLIQGMGECVVQWSLEPEYAQWTFCRNNTALEFRITDSHSKNLQFSYRGNLRSIIHRIIKGLSDLAVDECWSSPDRSDKIWSWPFPTEELAQLKALYANSIHKEDEPSVGHGAADSVF